MKTARIIVMILSLMIAVVSSILYVVAKRNGASIPIYVIGMLTYGWVFVLFFAIDRIAAIIKRSLRD